MGGGRSSDYRDAWWYKPSETASGQKSEESEEAQSVYAEPEGVNNVMQRVDFNCPELCAQTRPLSCAIKGQTITLKKQTWSHLLVAITEWFIDQGKPQLSFLERMALLGKRNFFMQSKADSGRSVQLSNGRWIYVNYAPKNIVIAIKRLCEHCDLGLDDVIIT